MLIKRVIVRDTSSGDNTLNDSNQIPIRVVETGHAFNVQDQSYTESIDLILNGRHEVLPTDKINVHDIVYDIIEMIPVVYKGSRCGYVLKCGK